MRPFRLGKKVWEKAMVTKRLDEQSYEVDTQVATYQQNRADLQEPPLPKPLEQNSAPAVTLEKDTTPQNLPPEKPAANQTPSEK